MARQTTVRLEPNGKYWRACWTDSTGKRRRQNIGQKAALSKRQARVLCDRLAAQMHLNPARIDADKAPTLGEWINRFNEQKAGGNPSTLRSYKLAQDYLTEFFGDTVRLDRITKARVADFVAAMSQGRIHVGPADNRDELKMLAEGSVCNYVRHAKAIFEAAVKQDVILSNPLKGQKTQPKNIRENNYYLSRDEFAKILLACPNVGWRVLLALQRLGGLRLSEAINLQWGTVDWETRIVTFRAGKTGQVRRVPMAPELYRLMLEAFEAAEPGETMVLSENAVCRTSGSTLHKRFRRIIRKAGLTPWADLFQNLRRNAAQDFRAEFKDPWIVTSIMGHSEEVERKYYLGQVRDTDLAQVTGVGQDDGLARLRDAWSTLTPEVQRQLLEIMEKTQHQK